MAVRAPNRVGNGVMIAASGGMLGNKAARSRMFNPAIEALARADLEALQLDRLRKIISRAQVNVPHYREVFNKAGLGAEKIGSLEDIRRFPFTTKDDLRRSYPFGMFAVPIGSIARMHASSGTTGKPTVVAYTAGDLETWAELMARSMAGAGVGPDDIFHNAYGYGLFTGGLGFHDGAHRLGAAVVPVSGGNTERQVMLLRDFGATVLGATPSYALTIAETAERMGIDLRSGPLRIGIFGAEPWSDAMRAEIEARLGILAIDMYGLSEIMGPGVACECAEARDGQHAWEDHFLFEVINPHTGDSLPPGEIGELVITTLTKEALPMIRYRTRDMTRLTEEPCRCGRTHCRIMRIGGRSDDMLIIRGVNLYPSQIEAVLVGVDDIAPHYQLVVSREGAMDELTVEVELDIGTVYDSARIDQARRAVSARIKTMVGISCRVVVKDHGTIPRSEGKAVRVRDLRKEPV